MRWPSAQTDWMCVSIASMTLASSGVRSEKRVVPRRFERSILTPGTVGALAVEVEVLEVDWPRVSSGRFCEVVEAPKRVDVGWGWFVPPKRVDVLVVECCCCCCCCCWLFWVEPKREDVP